MNYTCINLFCSKIKTAKSTIHFSLTEKLRYSSKEHNPSKRKKIVEKRMHSLRSKKLLYSFVMKSEQPENQINWDVHINELNAILLLKRSVGGFC